MMGMHLSRSSDVEEELLLEWENLNYKKVNIPLSLP